MDSAIGILRGPHARHKALCSAASRSARCLAVVRSPSARCWSKNGKERCQR